MVLMKDINEDEIETFVNITKYENIDVRFIELMPMGNLSFWAQERFVPNTIVLEKIKGLQKVSQENSATPAVYYKFSGAKGRVGLINSMSKKFCGFCNRVRLTADGRLKPCLHLDDSIDLKTPLRQEKDIKEVITKAIFNKPRGHELEKEKYADKNMIQIGG